MATFRHIFRFAAGHDDDHDQPLTEAARVALEANLTPRVIKMRVQQDGTPIEIPEVNPLITPVP